MGRLEDDQDVGRLFLWALFRRWELNSVTVSSRCAQGLLEYGAVELVSHLDLSIRLFSLIDNFVLVGY